MSDMWGYAARIAADPIARQQSAEAKQAATSAAAKTCRFKGVRTTAALAAGGSQDVTIT